ncbi:LuxR family transcriptional regulator, partial [Bacillus wiedmannii]
MGFKQEIRKFIEGNKLVRTLLKKPLEYRANKQLQLVRNNIKQYGVE